LREFDRAFESLSRAVDDGSVWTRFALGEGDLRMLNLKLQAAP
jgi:hypothetical protein